MKFFKTITIIAIIFPTILLQADDTLDADLDALLSDDEKVEVSNKEDQKKTEEPMIVIESQPDQTIGPTIKTFFYIVEQENNFKDILIDEIGFSDEVLFGQGYLKKLLSANAHISDVRNIKVGTRLYIEHPHSMPLKIQKIKN